MTDRKINANEKDVKNFDAEIALMNKERAKVGIEPFPSFQEGSMPRQDQCDIHLFPIINKVFQEHKQEMVYEEVPGGTGYNVVQGIISFLGERAKDVDFNFIPTSSKNAEAFIVHLPNDREIKAAFRPASDTVLTDEYKLWLKDTSGIVISKSAVNLNPEVTTQILDYLAENNPDAFVLMALNGSDPAEHPELFLKGSKAEPKNLIWFATDLELARKQYDGVREKFRNREDYTLVVMNGDRGENGFDIHTPTSTDHFAPMPTDASHPAGVRDVGVAFVVCDRLGMIGPEYYVPYRNQVLGHLLTAGAARVASSEYTDLRPTDMPEVKEQYTKAVSEEQRQLQLLHGPGVKGPRLNF
ncbi:MAG: hypothetical protein PHW76_06520 [Alphaproteobacteria bacterium]|nr:hypothetical protein [Alphaproteobacteria bacterium]